MRTRPTATCYDADNSVLRCAADPWPRPELVGFEFLAERSVDARFDGARAATPRLRRGFASAILAQMTWSGERRGRPRCRDARPGAALRRARASLPRDLRRPRVARAAQRGELRAERPPGARSSAASTGSPPPCPSISRRRRPSTRSPTPRTRRSADRSPAVLMPGARGSSSPLVPAFPTSSRRRSATSIPASAAALVSRRERAALLRVVARRRRPLRRGLAAARRASTVAARRSRSTRRGASEGGLVVVFFAEERARSPTTTSSSDAASAVRPRAAPRAQRAATRTSGRARALAQQLARTGQPARDGARAGRDPRRGRPTRPRRSLGADALRDPAGRGRRARRQLRSAARAARRRLGSRARRPLASGDVVQSRSPVVSQDAEGDARLSRGRSDPRRGPCRLPRACRSSGLRRGLQGVLAVYAQRPRAWREEESRGARRARRERVRRCSRTPSSTSASRSSGSGSYAILVQHRRRDRRRRPRGQGRALERRRRRRSRASRRRRARPDAGRGAPARARVRRRRRRRRAAAVDPARRRRGLALAHRGRHARPGRRRSRAASSPSATSPPSGIVEQMKSDLRLDRLARAARAADVDLRLRRDAAPRATSSSARRSGATFLEYIASESQRLTSIVDTLLSVARLDAGDLQVDARADRTSGAVVSDAVSSVQEGAVVNGHRFVLDAARRAARRLGRPREARPDPAGTCSTTRSSSRRTAARSRSRRTLPGRRASRSASSDEGDGIPAGRARADLLEVLPRATARPVAAGTGLGLFIARGLVAAMRRAHLVDSAEGGGLELRVRAPPRAEATEPGAGGYRRAMAATRVLVIDDEAPIRPPLPRQPRGCGDGRATRPSDGATGLEVARRETTGRDPARRDDARARRLATLPSELLEDERTAEIPVVFLTARAELRDQARGLELGGVDYVTKPFDPLELAPLIDDLLERIERGERPGRRRRERLAEPEQLLDQRLSASGPTKSAVTSRRRAAGQARPRCAGSRGRAGSRDAAGSDPHADESPAELSGLGTGRRCFRRRTEPRTPKLTEPGR